MPRRPAATLTREVYSTYSIEQIQVKESLLLKVLIIPEEALSCSVSWSKYTKPKWELSSAGFSPVASELEKWEHSSQINFMAPENHVLLRTKDTDIGYP